MCCVVVRGAVQQFSCVLFFPFLPMRPDLPFHSRVRTTVLYYKWDGLNCDGSPNRAFVHPCYESGCAGGSCDSARNGASFGACSTNEFSYRVICSDSPAIPTLNFPDGETLAVTNLHGDGTPIEVYKLGQSIIDGAAYCTSCVGSLTRSGFCGAETTHEDSFCPIPPAACVATNSCGRTVSAQTGTVTATLLPTETVAVDPPLSLLCSQYQRAQRMRTMNAISSITFTVQRDKYLTALRAATARTDLIRDYGANLEITIEPNSPLQLELDATCPAGLGKRSVAAAYSNQTDLAFTFSYFPRNSSVVELTVATIINGTQLFRTVVSYNVSGLIGFNTSQEVSFSLSMNVTSQLAPDTPVSQGPVATPKAVAPIASQAPSGAVQAPQGSAKAPASSAPNCISGATVFAAILALLASL